MKAFGEATCIAPLFLNLALNGAEWLISGPGRFNPGDKHRYPLNRSTDGPQSWSESFGEEKMY